MTQSTDENFSFAIKKPIFDATSLDSFKESNESHRINTKNEISEIKSNVVQLSSFANPNKKMRRFEENIEVII